LAMTRRDVGKPAFSLRKKRFVKTHALSLLRTKNLRYAVLRFQDFQRKLLLAFWLEVDMNGLPETYKLIFLITSIYKS
ncbi:MAG TPA: hypothetical protein VIF10_10675, partial [Methylobacter sp.]